MTKGGSYGILEVLGREGKPGTDQGGTADGNHLVVGSARNPAVDLLLSLSVGRRGERRRDDEPAMSEAEEREWQERERQWHAVLANAPEAEGVWTRGQVQQQQREDRLCLLQVCLIMPCLCLLFWPYLVLAFWLFVAACGFGFGSGAG